LRLTDFQHFPGPVAFFQDFSVLENATVKFQDFPGFPGAVGTLLSFHNFKWSGLFLLPPDWDAHLSEGNPPSPQH